MNIRMAGHAFTDVSVPVLWGARAVLQDEENKLAVIDLQGDSPQPEIVGDAPAPGIPFQLLVGGFTILLGDGRSYSYFPSSHRLTSPSLGLPDCVIGSDSIIIGTNTFSGLDIRGMAVGIAVSEDSIGVGAPLPPGLARYVVPPTQPDALDRESRHARYRAVEHLVAERLGSAFADTHDVLVTSALGSQGGAPRADIVLHSRFDDLPDALVDVKYFTRAPTPSALMAGALLQLAKSSNDYSISRARPVVPVVLVVMEGHATPSQYLSPLWSEYQDIVSVPVQLIVYQRDDLEREDAMSLRSRLPMLLADD